MLLWQLFRTSQKYTVFTRMQDDSNLRWPPPPSRKMCLLKKYCTINFIHLIHNTCHIQSAFTISVTVCIFTVSVFIFLAQLLIFPSSLLPFHNISSSVSYTALDIQHFLNPFTVTTGEMHCRAIMIYIDWIIHFYFLAFKPTWTYEDSQFSSWLVLKVLRI
jgi:hypothetical protein